ncbi:MAG: TonB-dependent receptor [Caulobacteraceae bacterium]|nr:TonB-dependent receptor [Caulobacteraceae bacterium]
MSGRWAGRSDNRRRVTPAILLATTMLAGASGAHAAAATAAAAAAPAGDSTALQEVIVTAQKRSENIQSVPANVQAFGTQKIEQLHIQDFNDYIKFLPSVTYQSVGPGFSNVYMRGVAADNQSNHSGSQPSVGTYLDEQPITTVGGALDIHLYDIARVEALAGPQGTLYGASSEAGTIRIITNKPEIGKFSAGYDIEGNTVSHGGVGGTVEGFVNIPVNDKMAVRLVGWDEHDAGYIDNVYGTRTFSTGITVNNAAYVKKNYNAADTIGGRAALRIDLNNNWTITPMIIAQDERNDGIFAYDPSVGDLKVSHFRPEGVHDRWYQASLTIQGKIADFDVIYSGGYMDRKINSESDYTDYSYFYDKAYGYAAYFHDNAGHNIDPTQYIIGRDHFTKDSHELRISSPQSLRFRFIGGLFYQDQQHYIIQDYTIKGLADSNAEPGVQNLSVDGWPGTFWLTDQLRTDKDYAVFGEASFDITPALTFTAGIRGYKATSTLEGFYGFGLNGYSSTGEHSCFSSKAAVAGDPCTNLDKRISDTGETHKLNLTYHLTDDKLVYATYSTGFRPGGANRNGNLPPYQPDYLTNYEVGWKTSWLDRALRFNGDFYFEKWKNFQFSYLGQNSLTIVANAGDASIFGIESDVSWRVTHGLTISASGAYTDSTLDQDFCGGAACSSTNLVQAPKGTQLPVTPKYKANATARYEFDLAGLNAFIQGSVVYEGSSWSDLLTQAPIPYSNPADYVPIRSALGKQAAYTTADFSAGISRDNWHLDLMIENAFDTRGQIYRYAECTIQICGAESYIVPTRPRMIALKFGQKF